MRPGDALSGAWRALARADDGVLMRSAFYALLVTAAIFLVVDIREFANEAAGSGDEYGPAREPMTDQPLLPPAVTDGKPQDAPVAPKTDATALRQPIRFELTAGGVLEARGTIDPGSADRFRTEIEARGEYVKIVSLDSPGGAVNDALAISALIREKKLTTRVRTGALCASSCPLVMAGGIVREAEKDAVIGVHQVFNGGTTRPTAEEAMAGAQATTARLARHLDAMGIAPGLWFHALETPPDRLYYLSEAELKEFRLVTAPPPPAVARKKT
ncbi:hypothetical protein J2858_001169 [Neorhizobium galegae]|uniref:COG3904 family protein n=1 Tax=Neorhizobium galegae TaxID=399 RepID=UPI001AEA7D07|nr:hypothetical protein [Neorhizobium galegae]MBP2548276.1 hypothetical protein [Neorhizobium galegae]